jgi:hypothetical protein
MNNTHIQLTFAGTADQPLDPALVAAVARESVAELRAAGYTVEPAYTGARGSVPFDIILQLAQRLHEGQPLLTEVVKLITPIVAALLTTRRKPVAANQSPPQITVVVHLDHARVVVPIDKAQDDAWLLEQLLAADPALAKTTVPESHVALDIQVAAPPRTTL